MCSRGTFLLASAPLQEVLILRAPLQHDLLKMPRLTVASLPELPNLRNEGLSHGIVLNLEFEVPPHDFVGL